MALPLSNISTTDAILDPEAEVFMMPDALDSFFEEAWTDDSEFYDPKPNSPAHAPVHTPAAINPFDDEPWSSSRSYFNTINPWSYVSPEAIDALTSYSPEAPGNQTTSEANLGNWMDLAAYEAAMASSGLAVNLSPRSAKSSDLEVGFSESSNPVSPRPNGAPSEPTPTFSEATPTASGTSTIVGRPAPTVSKLYLYRSRPLNLNIDGSVFCSELFPPMYGEESSSVERAILDEKSLHPGLNVDISLYDTTGEERKIAFNLLAEHLKFQILREGRHPANVFLPWRHPIVGEWTIEKALKARTSVIHLDRDAWAYLQGPIHDRSARDFFAQVWRVYGREDTCHNKQL